MVQESEISNQKNCREAQFITFSHGIRVLISDP